MSLIKYIAECVGAVLAFLAAIIAGSVVITICLWLVIGAIATTLHFLNNLLQ